MNWKALILAAAIPAVLLCGCEKPENQEPTQPDEIVTEAPTQPPTEPVNMEAVEFLKLLYTEDNVETAVDYVMLDLFQTDSGKFYKVEWSVDVSEDLVRIVPNENGSVTVDVNELCQQDTPYTLTASMATAEGYRITHSWHFILPKVRDMVTIVEEAYALGNGQRLPGQYTLTGKIISVEKAWSEDYQNISVIISIEGCGRKTVRCYGLTGEGAESLRVGDEITVSGVIKKYNGRVEFDSGCKLEPSKPEAAESVDSEQLTPDN